VSEESKHAVRVDGWMERVPERLAPEQLVSAFEQGFTALWRRTEHTLGAVTLSAIIHRVLHDVSKGFPLFAILKIEGGCRVNFDDLRQRAPSLDARQLREGMRAFFLRFFALIGILTGDTLTPALHAALDNVTLDDLATAHGAEPRNPAVGESRGER
jgi:hypothetical protein